MVKRINILALTALLFAIQLFAETTTSEKNYFFEKEHIGDVIKQMQQQLNCPQIDSSMLDDLNTQLYGDSWTSERLNPYGISIENILDSQNIDCTDFVYPLKSNLVMSNFGERGARFHYGIDIALKRGDKIRSTFSGKVRIVDYERRGYGHYIVVRHNNGFETVYAHLSKVIIKENDSVQAGQLIGLGGSTGRSTGPHLHYEVRYQGNAFNPTKLINFKTKSPKLTSENHYLVCKADTYVHKTTLAKIKEARYCKVRSGDTLSHIARRYGTSVSRLCRMNKIRSTSILRIGQRIRYR